ncbi:MAG: Gfo/Idh/MocA family oxidoreductase [Thermodesulfobacteriota bacterium]
MTVSRKIRVGVIGVGYLGRLHAEKYAAIDGAELVGVADLDTARAGEIAAAHGTRAVGSYRDFIGSVDAVSVVTPTQSHCPIALEFLSRGVDVLVEKPIALDTAEADSLVAEAKRTGAVLQVGHLERFNAAISALEGKVQDPRLMDARRVSPFPNRSTDVDVVLDVMIHDIDIVLHLAASEVVAVEASGLPVVTDMPDVASARLVFANGCVANITASRVAKDKQRKLDIYTGNAVIGVDFASQQLCISRPVERAGAAFKELADDELNVTKRDSLLEELKSFISCSAAGSTPPVTGTDGRDALHVAQMIQDSIRLNAGRAAR